MAANTSTVYVDLLPGANTSVSPSSTISAAGCTRLTSKINVVPAANIDTSSYAVGLPTLAAGQSVYVVNFDSAQALTIFPPSGGTIDAGAADSQTTLAAGKAATFHYGSTIATYKLPGA